MTPHPTLPIPTAEGKGRAHKGNDTVQRAREVRQHANLMAAPSLTHTTLCASGECGGEIERTNHFEFPGATTTECMLFGLGEDGNELKLLSLKLHMAICSHPHTHTHTRAHSQAHTRKPLQPP
jgi:hypothetical protein